MEYRAFVVKIIVFAFFGQLSLDLLYMPFAELFIL